MQKTIKIDSKNAVRLDNNVGWMFIYRDQFGRDIVPALIPLLNAGIDLALGIYKQTGGKMSRDVLMSIDADALTDAMIQVSGIEAVDLLQIVWALAKNADESIDEPRVWFRQFDTFPVDIIAPAVFDLVFKGMVSTKNLKRLQALKESLRPVSSSTGSSSEGSVEG